MPRKIRVGSRARARRDRLLTTKLKFTGRHQRDNNKDIRRLSSQRVDSGETDCGQDFRHDIAALVFCGKREYIVIKAMPLTGWVTTAHIIRVLGLVSNVFTREVVNVCLESLYTKMLVNRKLSIPSNASFGFQYRINTAIRPDRLPCFSLLCKKLENMGI